MYETNIEALFASERVRERNRNRTRTEAHNAYDCYFCAAPIVKGRGFLITIVDGGHTLVPDDRFTDVTDPGYMGGYPVGSSCAVKIKKHFKSVHGVTLLSVRKGGLGCL